MAAGRKTGGRKVGTPNKATQRVRDAIAVFAEGNVDRLQVWLDQVAEKNPAKAADIYMRMLEYHTPKMRSVEHSGDPDNPLTHKIEYEIVD